MSQGVVMTKGELTTVPVKPGPSGAVPKKRLRRASGASGRAPRKRSGPKGDGVVNENVSPFSASSPPSHRCQRLDALKAKGLDHASVAASAPPPMMAATRQRHGSAAWGRGGSGSAASRRHEQ